MPINLPYENFIPPSVVRPVVTPFSESLSADVALTAANGHHCNKNLPPLAPASLRHNNRHHHHHHHRGLNFIFLLSSTFLLLFLCLLSGPSHLVASSSSQTAAGPMPDHIRVAVIIDNSTSMSSYAAKQAAYLESAGKFYSFMDKTLILDQTRLIVNIIRLPAKDVLTSTRLLCKELQTTSNLVAIIVGDVGSSLMSYIVGFANDAEIPLIDLISDIGRYLAPPTKYAASTAVNLLEPGFVVYMRPSSALHLTTAIEDLMAVYKWERMLLLYDKAESLTQMQKLLGDVGVDGVPTEKAVFRLNNSNLFEVTQSIKFRWPTVVVALDETMTNKFLRVALRTGILSTGFSFILTNPNAHFISMEDFAQNFPNVTLLRFINDNEVTRNILENARRFEEIQSNRYRVLVPDDSVTNSDDIPRILAYNREIPITLTAALLLDALTLVRRAVASIFSPDPWNLGPTTTAPPPQASSRFAFKPTTGLACLASQQRTSLPSKSPYGQTVLKALLANSAAFEGVTGTVAFNPKTNFRDVTDLEILGLGGVGLQRIGTWGSDAAVLRDTTMMRLAEQQKQRVTGVFLQDTTTQQIVPSKVLSPRELRLHLDEDSVLHLRRANVLTNRTLVSTTIKKKTLIVTTVLEEPYVMHRKDKSKPAPNSRSIVEHGYEGYCVDLLDEIAGMTGFTYRLQIVADGAYGSLNRKTGRWTGMIGEVIEGKADIAVAPLTITYAREQVVDFTKPFMNLGISILYLQPFKEKPSVFSFMQPLAGEIWGYVSLSYVVVTFIFYAVGRFSPYEWHSTGYEPTPSPDEVDRPCEHHSPFNIENHVNVFTLGNSSWFTAGTLMQQGSDVNPRALSTRIVGGAWWFFSLIIISSYTANLAAFLTVETVYSPFESAEELAKQGKIMYGAVKGGSTENFFRESKIDTYRTMWANMQGKDVFVKNNSEGINRVRSASGNYAYLMESISLEYIIQSPTLNKDCDLRQVGGLLDSKGYGIATARESPYRDVLSMAILQLQENDRLQLLYNKWWKSSGTCVREETKPKVLGTQNIGGIFAILLIGLVISLISLAVEVLWYARQHNPHDDRPYWRRLIDNFRLITTFRSKITRPTLNVVHSNRSSQRSRLSSAKRSHRSPSASLMDPLANNPLTSPQRNNQRHQVLPSPSTPSNHQRTAPRRSRSFHGSTDDGSQAGDAVELPVLNRHEIEAMIRRQYYQQAARYARESPALPPRFTAGRDEFEVNDDDDDDGMDENTRELIRSGLLANLSPPSRASALALLKDMARKQRIEEATQQLRAASGKSPSPKRKQAPPTPTTLRVPMVSFHSSFKQNTVTEAAAPTEATLLHRTNRHHLEDEV